MSNVYYGNSTKEQREKIEKIIEKKIFVKQTELVEILFSKGVEKQEDVDNFRVDIDEMNLERLMEYADEEGIEYRGQDDGEDIEYYRYVILEEIRDEQDPQDIQEWWLVAPDMADYLMNHGEPVLETNYGAWWGRTRSGQEIIMDPTLWEIYSEIL